MQIWLVQSCCLNAFIQVITWRVIRPEVFQITSKSKTWLSIGNGSNGKGYQEVKQNTITIWERYSNIHSLTHPLTHSFSCSTHSLFLPTTLHLSLLPQNSGKKKWAPWWPRLAVRFCRITTLIMSFCYSDTWSTGGPYWPRSRKRRGRGGMSRRLRPGTQ